MDVTWDDWKADRNIKKHGVSFEEAATVIGDPLARVFFDNCQNEERLLWVGNSARERLLVVITVERRNHIRIISARPPTARERDIYEEGI